MILILTTLSFGFLDGVIISQIFPDSDFLSRNRVFCHETAFSALLPVFPKTDLIFIFLLYIIMC